LKYVTKKENTMVRAGIQIKHIIIQCTFHFTAKETTWREVISSSGRWRGAKFPSSPTSVGLAGAWLTLVAGSICACLHCAVMINCKYAPVLLSAIAITICVPMVIIDGVSANLVIAIVQLHSGLTF